METRRAFLHTGLVTGAGITAGAAAAPAPQAPAAEWRNRQSGMAYRRLGRTGMMISEIVSGGDPIRTPNYRHLRLAVEMGLNYFDMAPAYGNGDCELAYGKFLAENQARDQVFLTTKISGIQGVRQRLYREIFDGLPAGKQDAIRQRSRDLIAERGSEKPGYFLDYFPGIRYQLPPAYLAIAMMPDYAHKVEGSRKYQEFITQSLEGSLKRIGVDHFDTVMCPHGACAPEELDMPEIYETFARLKKQGKVRFLGVTSHTDPAGVLRKATELGYYDVVQCAYNCVNGGYLEEPIRQARAKGIGIIAMKAAMAVATHHTSLQPVPQWRIDMINRIVPGDLKPPLKAYIWALQNPHISACVSNLWDETYVRENLSVAGRTVELQRA